MRIRIAAIAAALFLCGVNITSAQNGQALFQQGQLKERGERNIEDAIRIYERVAREFSSNHELAAKALFQLGMIHENLGKPQARRYYDSIIKEYPDQTEIRAEAERRRKALDSSHPASVRMPDRIIWLSQPLSDAAVSSDGAYFAFIDRSPGGGLMIRDLKTGAMRRLPTASGEASSPAISRDGKRVAYSTYDLDSGKSELHVLDLDSGADRILIESSNLRYRPQDWAPTGEILTLFSLKGGGCQIVMVSVSGGLTSVLKAFLTSDEPRHMTLSPDGRFIAYDYPQEKNSASRDIHVLGVSGGSHEYELVHDTSHDYVLGWMPDSRWLLFGSDRGGKSGIWGIETSEGKSTATPPLPVRDSDGEIRALGITSSASLVYSSASKTGEVRVLEGLQPELARLQLSALQQRQPPQDLSNGSIEGVVVKLGTNEPIPGADLELTRLEGTATAPLFPGFAEAYRAFILHPPGAGT
jgi:Tetratricopeptide repeat/WD40-like Beta Propeller Repeat